MKLIVTTLRDALRTPGFTMLYVGGVAFTMAFTIVYGLILYAQLGPVYPEYDRMSNVYVNKTIIVKEKQQRTGRSLGRALIDDHLRGLSTVEDMTVQLFWWRGYQFLQPGNGLAEFRVSSRDVEPSFFRFYPYQFVAGGPFTQEEFDAKEKLVVITDRLARRLFPTVEDAVGQSISLDLQRYRVTGVVREASALCIDSYGEVFKPYSITEDYKRHQEWPYAMSGSLQAVFRVKPGQEARFRDEIREICRRINSVDTAGNIFYIPNVMNHSEHIFLDNDIDWSKEEFPVEEARPWLALYKPQLIALLVVLIVPALNISGLIGARMDRRMADIGVRRCFGATRRRLMGMVMTENLILTLAGGLLGLILSWIIVALAGDTLLVLSPLDYSNLDAYNHEAGMITVEMAFAPVIFIFTLLLCVVLNMLSAWIPVRSALRRPIVASINTKR